MKRSPHLKRLAAGLFFLGLGAASFAQTITSTPATVTLNATLTETLTVSATPTTVNFALVPGGVASGSAPVSITTTWVLGTNTSVILAGYFSSATSALNASTNLIPTSAVSAQIGSGSFNAFTTNAAVGPAGAGLNFFTQSITSANKNSNRTDTMNLQIDLTSLPQLPAATYSGTLNIVAYST